MHYMKKKVIENKWMECLKVEKSANKNVLFLLNLDWPSMQVYQICF